MPFVPKFCALILKFSYIFNNFANGNVNFSIFETIWLILTPRHTFNEEIWKISQQNITLLKNFFSKLISCFRIFGQKVYPGKWHISGYLNIASTPPPPPSAGFATSKSWGKQLKAFDRSVRVAPTILFSARHLRHVSIILKRTCWQLYCSL